MSNDRPKWIPIEERLPRHGVAVLVLTKFEEVAVGWYDMHNCRFNEVPANVDDVFGPKGIEYWRPIEPAELPSGRLVPPDHDRPSK